MHTSPFVFNLPHKHLHLDAPVRKLISEYKLHIVSWNSHKIWDDDEAEKWR